MTSGFHYCVPPPAAAPQYFADALPDTNETTTDNGGAGGQAADAGGWKYWEQPSDGSEFMCPYNTSGKPEVRALREPPHVLLCMPRQVCILFRRLMLGFSVSQVLDWGDGNKQPSAQECSKSCK